MHQKPCFQTYSVLCSNTGQTLQKFTINNEEFTFAGRAASFRNKGRRGSIPRDDENRRCSFTDNADVELARVMFARRCSLSSGERHRSLNYTTEVLIRSPSCRKMFRRPKKRQESTSYTNNDVVKSGPARIKSRTFKIWQKKWLVFRRASSQGPCRLEKYKQEDSALTGKHGKSLPLKNLEKVEKLPPRGKLFTIRLVLSENRDQFLAFEDETEADSWAKVLLKECLGSIYSGEPDLLSSGVQKDLQERFPVFLQPSAERNIQGECYLQVTPEHIYIWDAEEPKLKLMAWPLTALRRYGYDKAKFTLESGRHCTTGEGLFTFRTGEGEDIYKKVHSATMSIAESHQRQVNNLSKRYSVNQLCVPNR